MSLIDADKLERHDEDIYGYIVESVYALEIDNAPAVDATPVVRCRERMYSWEDLSGLCCSYGPCAECLVPPDFWCAYGKRKEPT